MLLSSTVYHDGDLACYRRLIQNHADFITENVPLHLFRGLFGTKPHSNDMLEKMDRQDPMHLKFVL
jgi:hypothetical protein